MVLVHVGYLVLPVFGSVRNRGIAFSFRGLLRSVDRRRHRGGGGRRGRPGAQGTPARTQGERWLPPTPF
ncbi:ring finger protein 165 [Homo sapiens]|uniref:Arkadia (RNF111) C-terminal like ring finger ubiquitin ligase 2C n=1 Tax=Homo sapiens TaxID=9606 RepID=K7EPZ9_HUMAN|nr:ring finger protein 165 [Homo sapiens]KAI4046161.1 ring finger protein 165 [Homo sapiens]